MKTLAVLSQKGGVGKSTIARLMATAYAGVGWRVKLADFNVKQLTSVDWAGHRLKNELTPEVPAEAFANVKKALTQQTQYDLMVFDGKPDSDTITLEIARESDLILIPAQVTLDDLSPQVKFAHELLQRGVERSDILFVLNKTLDSAASIADAKGFIEAAGYRCAATDLPVKTGYQLAQNQGRAINESQYPSLNERADALAQEIIDRFTELAGTKR
ncbi:ParA family protein [Methylobacterium oryzae]|uniref:ParA family protein n=1 Tax=Methylobacterium oryzae TaxID=334852 RepID=UPI001F2567E3|nr:ParA family protein [Methylobacterium oryzae]UIN38409.1 ParA family protein [Methylobacterium oryzae]